MGTQREKIRGTETETGSEISDATLIHRLAKGNNLYYYPCQNAINKLLSFIGILQLTISIYGLQV